MSIALLIIGLVLFIGLIVVHELGHFIMARRNGVEVEEFGIGFPPKAWGKRIKSPKGDYDFTINWLPLGGFVRLKGENDEDDRPGSFGAARLKGKVQIMLAGVVMNLGAAFVLFTLAALVGIPQFTENQFKVASDSKIVRQDVLVGYIEPSSPAAQSGLQTRDRLQSITPVCEGKCTPGTALQSAHDLMAATKNNAGQTVRIDYTREGEQKSAQTQLRSATEVEASKKTDNPKGYLGLTPVEYTMRRSTWSAPLVAAGTITQFTQQTFKSIGTALTGLFSGNTQQATEQVAGPVGIFVILKDGSLLGYQFVLFMIAIISLTLAIMNVLPIPALDGGRLFVTLLFRTLRRQLTKRTEELIHGTGFALLMVLFVLITIVDIKRFF